MVSYSLMAAALLRPIALCPGAASVTWRAVRRQPTGAAVVSWNGERCGPRALNAGPNTERRVVRRQPTAAAVVSGQ
ncbi:MAG: hypothetical protein KJ000_29635 [Pirellulaceae bacterium]|nr:hypothetical protein [Pirellulaceae bacterium]